MTQNYLNRIQTLEQEVEELKKTIIELVGDKQITTNQYAKIGTEIFFKLEEILQIEYSSNKYRFIYRGVPSYNHRFIKKMLLEQINYEVSKLTSTNCRYEILQKDYPGVLEYVRKWQVPNFTRIAIERKVELENQNRK